MTRTAAIAYVALLSCGRIGYDERVIDDGAAGGPRSGGGGSSSTDAGRGEAAVDGSGGNGATGSTDGGTTCDQAAEAFRNCNKIGFVNNGGCSGTLVCRANCFKTATCAELDDMTSAPWQCSSACASP